ncbi:unnamed protein product [Chironomus riparius]|uniref:CD80-like immunoglobulin C2-set domain-containing protein n=1 Tax=Chironomus riparius TaxID=315576 RepID=A0A9P0ISX2_9DIPT|nr:unnamed protein product [Chironomus riparius]
MHKINLIIFSLPVFLFVVVVANSKAINYNNKVHLLCSYDKPISGCRFSVPGDLNDIHLFDDVRNLERYKYEYFGKGFKIGDCGITINNATSENEGRAICTLTVNNSFEVDETVEVKVFDFNNLHMGLPKLKILNSGPLKVSQTLAAECVMKSTDQYSKISWLLNDKLLNNSNSLTIKRFERDKGTVFELKSILKHQLDTLDNGSTLKCRTRVSNYSQEFVDTTLDLVVLNETRLMEPKIGLPFDISINVFAFPRVLSSRWKVNNRVIYYGKSTNEFISRELKYLGKNEWNAVLHIINITDLNIQYNYTLQVNDSDGTKYYNVRLDQSINEANYPNDESNNESTQPQEEETTISLKSLNISENSITSSPKLNFTKQQQLQQQKEEKSNTFRRTTTRYYHYNNNTISQPFTTERRTKNTRKQQKNTSISITDMTSVSSTTTSTTMTTTESSIIVVMTKAYTNETEGKMTTETAVDENSFKYEETTVQFNNNDEEIETKEFNTTTSKNLIEIIAIDNSNDLKRFETTIERFFIRVSFVTMVLIIVIFLLLLCHYRHQVTLLKTEIIQMNLENYYNQSCLYPLTFNDYSSTNFQQNDGVPFYIKRPLNVNHNTPNSSSGDSDISSSQFLCTYNTNSHLYQSIDADDIDNHVYDEIIQTKENDVGKPNNYENNESFNNINEMLIPSHCHTLMTIHEEEEELEASHIQILSKLESTYI